MPEKVGHGSHPAEFKVIEFGMLDKKLFFPLSSAGYLTCHWLLYPFTLIRTRLQVQEGHSVYRGMFHAFRVITAEEGVRALYRGVYVKCIQVLSGIFYIATYEGVRYRLSDVTLLSLSANQRSFIAGACASAVGQTMVVPIDVISQHLMVLRGSGDNASAAKRIVLTPLQLTAEELRTPRTRAFGVVSAIRRTYGVRGFYQGYFISLCTFVPNSALWWAFYNHYCNFFSIAYHRVQGDNPSRLPVQLVSAPLAGCSAAVIMNPVDIVRVRMQVESLPLRRTLSELWRKEGLGAWKKGLSARLTQSCFFSFWLTLCYEPVKWYCLKEEYRDSIELF